MSIFVAIILGLVQGLTEFLPVSSSGHLVLLEKIFGIQCDVIIFDVILHLATLIAVCYVYRKSIIDLIKHPFSKKAKLLVVATIPTCIIAILFKDFFENAFGGELLALGFFISAIYMLIAEYATKRNKKTVPLNYKNASVIGLFQGIAIMPAISRSGSTITSALVQGIDREEAAEFSFLLSIPIILISTIYESFKIGSITIGFAPILVGFVCAFISGFFAIKLMLSVIKKAKFSYFAVYLFILSIFLTLNKYVLFLF